MNKRKRISTIVFLLMLGPLSQPLAAKNLFLKMTPQFAYEDATGSCTSSMWTSALYFVATIKNNQITKAKLRRSPDFLPPFGETCLPEALLDKLELYRDETGALWIQTLPLDATRIEWVFFNMGTLPTTCKPPHPLETLEPSYHEFEFDTEGLGIDYTISGSDNAYFTGTNQKGDLYSATLRFVQMQLGGR